MHKLLEEFEEHRIIQKVGKDVDTTHHLGSAFFNPIIIIPKGDTIKLVLDARYLNSITDLTTYSWPLEPLHTLLTRIKGPNYTSADMSSKFH